MTTFLPSVDITAHDSLTQSQWDILFALADTVIPRITHRQKGTPEIQKSLPLPDDGDILMDLKPVDDDTQVTNLYLAESLSSIPGFQEFIQRLLCQNIHTEGRKGLLLILNALSTPLGSLLLTGSTSLFQHQPLDVRQRIFQSWGGSRIKPLRVVNRALLLIFKKAWTTLSPTLPQILKFSAASSICEKLEEGTKYEFLQFPPGNDPATIETDVVIVGSGCGGSVAARNLAEAGHRVLLVEKSYYIPNKHFPLDPLEGYAALFENGGSLTTDDGAMAVLAGSTWGGGGAVNWSAALQTQGYVREEWSNRGLKYFTSLDFQDSLDRVCERMGVNTAQVEHNYGNQMILSGAQKLGYHAKTVPQNTGNSLHYCGHCNLGCASAKKKGPRESFLSDAATSGATFIEGFDAHKILFEKPNSDDHNVATGVEGIWTSRGAYFSRHNGEAVRRRVIVRAKKVIVSCGALQSPLLLLRSGLRNPHLGRHLYLHPVLASVAIFDQDVRPWEGSALTTVVDSFQSLDSNGHGVKIEAPAMLPTTILPLLPWRDGLTYKTLASNLRKMAGFISLCRDKHSGRVYPDPVDGRCRIDYRVSSFDKRHLVEGLIACAKIAYVSGAREYHTSSAEVPPFIKTDQDNNSHDGVNNPGLQNWISQVREIGSLNNENAIFASAHQMGTCRMGISPQQSVVDPNGQVWGSEGLFVCDASIFPSASGVNPMVTNMAISDWISRRISRTLQKQEVPQASL